MILYARTLKRCFWDQIPWKMRLCYGIISILTFPKNNQTKFCFRCHRLIFISNTYVQIYIKHKFIDSRQYQNVTTWKSLMPLSVNWLYRCFTYLGGSFIGLTTHAFFILNIAKFKFEKMSKLTKLDWIFFFAGYYIRQRNLLVQTYYIVNTERQAKIFLRKSLGLFL